MNAIPFPSPEIAGVQNMPIGELADAIDQLDAYIAGFMNFHCVVFDTVEHAATTEIRDHAMHVSNTIYHMRGRAETLRNQLADELKRRTT